MARLAHMVAPLRTGKCNQRSAILLPLLMAVLLALPASAQSAWVQAVASGGYEARTIGENSQCPSLVTDKGEVAMTPRAGADARFPLLCSATLSSSLTNASIGGVALPLPKARPQRILVLGDTGCRISKDELQDCNDPRNWPFPSVAASAAALKPDLVVHLGDFLYRETPCPQGNAGCAGSPWGDNWVTWQADLFTPAAPLLAAAPWVITRGNHEDCTRAGDGYFRLLGPSSSDGCNVHSALYTIDLGGLTLAVMDDADAPDTEIDQNALAGLRAEIAGLGDLAAPVWLVHHRPIWSPISGPFGIPVGGNRTLIAAAGHSIPAKVQLMLSGHIHTFEAINYTKDVPPQLVAGNGGDSLHHAPSDLRGSIFQGSSGVRVKDGLSVGGFGFLLLTRDGPEESGTWTIDLFNPDGSAKGQCHLTQGDGGKFGRLDCPDLVAKK